MSDGFVYMLSSVAPSVQQTKQRKRPPPTNDGNKSSRPLPREVFVFLRRREEEDKKYVHVTVYVYAIKNAARHLQSPSSHPCIHLKGTVVVYARHWNDRTEYIWKPVTDKTIQNETKTTRIIKSRGGCSKISPTPDLPVSPRSAWPSLE